MTKKLDLSYIKEQFINRGWQCVANNYIKNTLPLECICDKGHKTSISWNNFQKGQGCKYCSGNIVATFEEVKSYFDDNNCELLSSKYINAFTPISYRCTCGTESSIRFVEFKRGHRCKNCMKKTLSEKFRTPEEIISELCKNNECEFIKSWIRNRKTRISYKCKCGNISEADLSNYKRYPNCKEC
jgi:hypothetical protein